MARFSFSSLEREREMPPTGGGSKGGILFPKRIPPLEPPEKGKGSYPLTPHIGSFYLEELHTLRSVGAVYMASP